MRTPESPEPIDTDAITCDHRRGSMSGRFSLTRDEKDDAGAALRELKFAGAT
jgi:hypothetical protein